jgi:hypothetical protein
MSHTALRRVAVRLLHDEDLARALHDDPDGALAGIPLSAEERAWLLAVPRGAWQTDLERPRRVLAALRDEFPASFALAPARAGAFVRSRHFHEAVQDRGSLAAAFGLHAAEDDDARVVAVARLETATALVRRAPMRVTTSPAGRLRLTPAGRVVHAAQGAAALLAAVRDGRPYATLGPAEEALLVLREPATLEVTIEPLSEALAELLGRAMTAAPRAELEAVARSLGADPDEASAIVGSLVADDVLV